MRGPVNEEEEFIHPYRENRRCFNKYFNNSLYLKQSEGKYAQKNQPGDFLDNVSRASSVRIRQNPFQNQLICQNQIKQEPQQSNFRKSNKQNINLRQNPQIYNLISKHVQKDQFLMKNFKNISSKKAESEHSSKYQIKSFSIEKLKKNPKITEFSRKTFYSKASSSKSSFSSKKQKQDNLHSSSNLDINSQKISLCKRTLPWKQKNTFVTSQVYTIKKRVGIDSTIMGGILKQIKFRLILNQSDTKYFQLYWNKNPQNFLEKCVEITEHGIRLKLGAFNLQNQSDIKLSPLKQVRKTYLKKYESFVKTNIKEKMSPIRVGNIVFCQQYKSQRQKTNISQTCDQKNDNHNKIQAINSKMENNSAKIEIISQNDPQKIPSLKSFGQINESIQFNNSSFKEIIEQNPSKVNV